MKFTILKNTQCSYVVDADNAQDAVEKVRSEEVPTTGYSENFQVRQAPIPAPRPATPPPPPPPTKKQ